MPSQTARPKVLLFDVNETLLDITPLKQNVGSILCQPYAAELWFTTLLQYSLVMTVAGQYAPFPEVGAAALQMLAQNAGVALSEAAAKAALAPMRSLVAHDDVAPALALLKAKGWRMAVLTNSSQAGVAAQMAHAGLGHFFERQLSVESVGKFKPHADVYRWAAQEMKVQASDCMLVAAHGWDVAGAKWAGMKTAFIAREGQQKFPIGPPPDLEVVDLNGLAGALGA